MTRREFEASFRYAPFGFKFLPAVHSFWVFFDCTFLDNSRFLPSARVVMVLHLNMTDSFFLQQILFQTLEATEVLGYMTALL